MGAMEHGVLGRCWAYDGCRDPVARPDRGADAGPGPEHQRHPRPGGHCLLCRRGLHSRRLPPPPLSMIKKAPR
ncbi:hypothetical protein ABCR94_32945 [Streptomyces sp. 21So2-11]|uniref:hypothetical protein n=1 Tax=Streptomyces sp. 21So2-11 TaxID=3144408 RepID=UPI00321915E7